MNPRNPAPRSTAITLGAFVALVFSSSASAALVTDWSILTAPTTGNLDTASPVLGNGGAESADGHTIYASTPTYSLNVTGDKITLSGTVTFAGLATPQADQFRIGFYDANGMSGANGWLGYFATNSGTSGGPTYSRLWERNNPNSNSFGSGTGATTVAYANATPSNTAFASGSYAFLLTATRTDTGLDLAWSYTSPALGYSVSGTYSDTTPQTSAFDRVGIFTGGGLNASQVSFANIDLSFTPAAVPESSSFAMIAGAAGALAVAGRRRRRCR